MCKQELKDKVLCNLSVPDAKFTQTHQQRSPPAHTPLYQTMLSGKLKQYVATTQTDVKDHALKCVFTSYEVIQFSFNSVLFI